MCIINIIYTYANGGKIKSEKMITPNTIAVDFSGKFFISSP